MSKADAETWARICRIEAARTSHPPTMAFLLELAAEYDALASNGLTVIDPDDPELQDAVADRLVASAARIRASRDR